MENKIDIILQIEKELKQEISLCKKRIINFNIVIIISFFMSFITIICIDNSSIIWSLLTTFFVIFLIIYIIYSLIKKRNEYEKIKNYDENYLLYVKSYARRNYNIHQEITLENSIQNIVLLRDTYEEEFINLIKFYN